ncbi:BON domain-containing protein [Longimicrobium terrae]|jgi:hypothetical protein|uniref:BON domain-containing protein n=1 Tax=Longimicrobium terrae TaxID=1639882 RepID=A0A841H1T5_9BACT|nr:BON domain-containing protein [Longimicrobium terrae]MBB4637573.1 hypothetical protein [Longimicrobium terrae]MBB6071970.1 hypothetical protein [Longimicrobium terrae]
MSRYDAGWGHRGEWNPGPRQGGMGPRANGYGDDFHPFSGFGGARQEFSSGPSYEPEMEFEDTDGEWQSGPLHGPARYGLGPYHQRLRSRTRPDAELKQEVEDALFYDTWVDAEAITVEVKDGVVTLTGELPDYQEVRYATDDAWDVEGVRGVHSELRVNTAKRPPRDGVPRRSAGDAR